MSLCTYIYTTQHITKDSIIVVVKTKLRSTDQKKRHQVPTRDMVLLLLTCVLQHLPQQWQLLPATLFLLLAILLLSIVFLVATRSRRRHHTNSTPYYLPPRASGLPILGNLNQMGALPHRSLRELARQHGPVMMLRLGTVPAVVVSSADAARDVLQTHDANCCSRPDMPGPRRLSYQHNDVAFSPYSEQWRERRRLLVVEFLTKRRIQATWHTRKIEVNKLIERLSSVERKPVALEDHIFGYMDGIIGTVAFGNVYGTEHFASKEHFHHVIDDAMVVRSSFSAEDYFPNAVGRLVDRLTGVASLRERVFRDFDAFFEVMLEQQLDPARGVKPSKDNGGLIDVLVSHMKEQQQGSFKLSRDAAKGILTNTYIGAVDTGAVTIIWAMAEMVRKPRVLRKAQEEVRAVVGSKGRVEQDDMAKLRYLKAVVMETLRLHPALPLLVPRETMRRVTVCGYDVPAKTRVLVNAWAIGRDTASWGDNAEEFVPERFESEEAAASLFNRAQFQLLPFGAGRRMCPGMDMGVATLEFTLANLLYCFDWELPEGLMREDVSMEEAGGLTLHKKNPLLLVPIRYNHRSVVA